MPRSADSVAVERRTRISIACKNLFAGQFVPGKSGATVTFPPATILSSPTVLDYQLQGCGFTVIAPELTHPHLMRGKDRHGKPLPNCPFCDGVLGLDGWAEVREVQGVQCTHFLIARKYKCYSDSCRGKIIPDTTFCRQHHFSAFTTSDCCRRQDGTGHDRYKPGVLHRGAA